MIRMCSLTAPSGRSISPHPSRDNEIHPPGVGIVTVHSEALGTVMELSAASYGAFGEEEEQKNVCLPVTGDGRHCRLPYVESFTEAPLPRLRLIREPWPRPSRKPQPTRHMAHRPLHIEIQDILVWMRPQPHGIDFLAAFVADPGLDQVLAEHPALEQKLMVLFEVA